MQRLKCQNCTHKIDLPKHCGKEMNIKAVDGKNMLVCWMGPDCGKQEIPQHCGKPMVVVD